MRIVYLTHSLLSCWNHGNAHFLRGVLSELAALGHRVDAWEPADGWSRSNLVADHGAARLPDAAAVAPGVRHQSYPADADVDAMLDGADLVIVHEWTEPSLIREIAVRRRAGARIRLLFHDTHHRAVTAPETMRRLPLDGFDGVLAFGEALAEVWRGWGWPAHVLHEAADTRLFHPQEGTDPRRGLVWIGNWGDDERARELEEFLLQPAAAAGLPLAIHGVRYPDAALALLRRHGADFGGWLPNHEVPQVFARHLATVHVPRRSYIDALPGIPTIRMFEALACGIPLAVALWRDTEGLFRPGDYLHAASGRQMTRHLCTLAAEPALRDELAARGLETIRERHTCAHRARELLEIAARLDARGAPPVKGAA